MSPLPAPEPRPAPTDASGARTELRERIADAIRRYDWDTGISANPEIGKHQWGEADAVLPVVEAALAAVEQRAEQAEAALQRVREAIEIERAGALESEAMDGPKPVHDARLNTCAHIEDALRTPTNPGCPEETR